MLVLVILTALCGLIDDPVPNAWPAPSTRPSAMLDEPARVPVVFQVNVPMPCTRRHAVDLTNACHDGCRCDYPGHCGDAACNCRVAAKPAARQTSRITSTSLPASRVQSPAAPGPAVYRLADCNGQVWTHADPTWLRTYVASRRPVVRVRAPVRIPIRPAFRFPVFRGRSTCGPGGCR